MSALLLRCWMGETIMWPIHVYRAPSKPLPKWLFVAMFWLIMPAAFIAMAAHRALQREATP